MRYNTALKFEDLFPERNDGLCYRCQKTLTGKQRKWCSDDCSIQAFNEMMLAKGSSTYIRRALLKRDKGICAQCGIDTLKIERIYDHSKISLKDYEKDLFERGCDYIAIDALGNIFDRTWQSIKFDVFSHHWEADHILEVVNGGSHTLENLQTLCIACHKEKTRQLAKSRTKQRAEKKLLPLFEI